MEPQDQPRLNRWSRQSQFSSCYSPQRNERNSSLSNRVSLVDAMDLELPENLNLVSNLLVNYEQSRFSGANRNSRNSRFSRESYSYKANMEDKDINRSSNYKTTHECSCQEDYKCNGVHCSCFLTPRQICVVGQCCSECIEMKNQFLMNTRGWAVQKEKPPQQQHIDETILARIKEKNIKNIHYFKQIYANEPNIRNLVYCTCKKSHCLKKYCLCYERGVKCGQLCNCLDCANIDKDQDEDFEQQRRWERYGTYQPMEEKPEKQIDLDMDIDQFMEQEMREGEFSETMEFQPPNFGSMTSNY